MKDNLKIPYGVSDFKTLRNEHLYYVDKSAYIRTRHDAPPDRVPVQGHGTRAVRTCRGGANGVIA